MPHKPPPDVPPEAAFVLHLRPLPSAVPPAVRLRRALKFLLRACGLRCVRVTAVVIKDAIAAERRT